MRDNIHCRMQSQPDLNSPPIWLDDSLHTYATYPVRLDYLFQSIHLFRDGKHY